MAVGVASAQAFTPMASGDIIASLANGQVNEYTPTGTLVQTLISGASTPTGSAFDGQGNLYVTEFASNDILKVDGKTGAVSTFSNDTILGDGTSFNSPESIAFGPGFTKMYVSDANRFGTGGGIHVIDPTTGKGIGFFKLPSSNGSEGLGESDWLALSPSASLFMTNENPTQGIMEVDQSTGDIVSPSFVPNLPDTGYAMSFDPSGNLWLSDTSRILEYDSSGNLLRTITNPSFSTVFSAVFDPPFKTIYAGDLDTGSIFTYDLNGNLLGTFNVGSGVDGLSVVGTVLPGTGGCSTTTTSSDPLDQLAALVCGYASDETPIVNAQVTILNAIASLPHVFQIGTTNVWLVPGAGALTASALNQIQTGDSGLNDALIASTEPLSDAAIADLTDRLGGIPCAASIFNDLVGAANDDGYAAQEVGKASQTLSNVQNRLIDGATSTEASGYADAAAEYMANKLLNLYSALSKAAGCGAANATLAAAIALSVPELEADTNTLHSALKTTGLVPTSGQVILGPVGTGAGLPVLVDPNQFPLHPLPPPLNVIPPLNIPNGAVINPGPLPALNTPPTVGAGGSITIGGNAGIAALAMQATMSSNPVRLATFKTDQNGNFSVHVDIPADTAPGKHELYAVGIAPDGSVRALAATITVNANGQPPKPPCIGTVSGTINGGLTVLPNMVCTLTNAHVNGTVTVDSGAIFEADSSTLNGGVTATKATAITLCGDQVSGSVTVQSSTLPTLIGGANTPSCATTTVTGSTNVTGPSALP